MTLTLTEHAVEAVKALVEASPGADGMRITANRDGAALSYRLSGVANPTDGDKVVEEEGARVFLESEVATELEHKVLDARIGADEQIAFFLSDG